jgi:hypothetical protein
MHDWDRGFPFTACLAIPIFLKLVREYTCCKIMDENDVLMTRTQLLTSQKIMQRCVWRWKTNNFPKSRPAHQKHENKKYSYLFVIEF